MTTLVPPSTAPTARADVWQRSEPATVPSTMTAAVLERPGRIALVERPVPAVGPTDALIRVTATSISDSDVRIFRGSHRVAAGRIPGHEVVGVIAALGAGVEGLAIGDRVVASATAACGRCYRCLEGGPGECGAGAAEGEWQLGDAIDGCHAAYVLVPDAVASLARVPLRLTDEQALTCPDVMSTGVGVVENARVRVGDVVVIVGLGPLGLCATAAASVRGASSIIVIDDDAQRLNVARRLGADVAIGVRVRRPIAAVMELTEGRGADVAIDGSGDSEALESCLRLTRRGGIVSILTGRSHAHGAGAFEAGLGGTTVVATHCPGGAERLRRLMSIVAAGRIDVRPLVTHHVRLAHIQEAYELAAHHRDGVIKVAIRP